VKGGPPIFFSTLILLAAAAAPPAARATPTPVPVRTIVGTIVSVDRAKGEVVISESFSPTRQAKRRAETIVLSLDASTRLSRGKTPMTLEDLAPGDHAVARYLGPPAAARAVSIRAADPVRPLPTPTRPLP
jgi:hypothetical protein